MLCRKPVGSDNTGLKGLVTLKFTKTIWVFKTVLAVFGAHNKEGRLLHVSETDSLRLSKYVVGEL